jgi:hypothetical protein
MAATGIVVGGSLAIVLVTASPALAYTRTQFGPSYAGVGDDRRWVEVCDLEQDGIGMYGEFRLSGGGLLRRGDPNGADGGCGNSRAGVDITEFRLCADVPGPDMCSMQGWVKVR